MVIHTKEQSAAVTSFISGQRSVQTLAHQLTPAQWYAPSGCAGWRVRDVIAHIIGDQVRGIQTAITRALAGDLTPPPDVRPDEVGRQTLTANSRDQATLQGLSDAELLLALNQTVEQSIALVESLTPEQRAAQCWTIFTQRPVPVEDVVRGYTAEAWAHERWDIRRPLGDRTPPDPALLRAQAEALVRLSPAMLIAEKAADWDATIGLTLTGPSGGEWTLRISHGRAAAVPGRPMRATTRFTMDPETFARVSWKRDHPLKAALLGKSKLSGNPIIGLKFGGLFPKF